MKQIKVSYVSKRNILDTGPRCFLDFGKRTIIKDVNMNDVPEIGNTTIDSKVSKDVIIKRENEF